MNCYGIVTFGYRETEKENRIHYFLSKARCMVRHWILFSENAVLYPNDEKASGTIVNNSIMYLIIKDLSDQ